MSRTASRAESFRSVDLVRYRSGSATVVNPTPPTRDTLDSRQEAEVHGREISVPRLCQMGESLSHGLEELEARVDVVALPFRQRIPARGLGQDQRDHCEGRTREELFVRIAAHCAKRSI